MLLRKDHSLSAQRLVRTGLHLDLDPQPLSDTSRNKNRKRNRMQDIGPAPDSAGWWWDGGFSGEWSWQNGRGRQQPPAATSLTLRSLYCCPRIHARAARRAEGHGNINDRSENDYANQTSVMQITILNWWVGLLGRSWGTSTRG